MRDWLGEAKAKQVYLVLRDRILSGAVGFGTKLPNENDLAGYHGVSRVTVRRALGELARERLIERRPQRRHAGYLPAIAGTDDRGYFRRARQSRRYGTAHHGEAAVV